YEQLSYLMLYFGAETAINVDGGGSSTMLFYNPETDYYDTMNRPSDNPLSLRSVANGMFFLYGNLEAQLPPSPYPDTREILTKPSHFYFGEDKMLKFDAVPNAEYYTIRVNGREKYRTTTNSYQFDFDYGTYELEIQAFGDFASYKQSSIETIEVSVFTPGVSNLIEGLKKYGQSANRK
ncbi:MAG: phosphodiester glycosidase family protein, partial [Acholeplasmataceae bacterium]